MSRDIRQLVKNMREEREWSQYDLAKRLDVSQALVAQWENGTCPVSKTGKKKLALTFGVTVDEIEGTVNLDHFSEEVRKWLQSAESVEPVTRVYLEELRKKLLPDTNK